MTLSQWLTYLEGLHPNEIELGLDRIRSVANNLLFDFSQQKIIIVGGTNGKGSTVSLLSSILSAADYLVGSYTSPHLLKYNERVCINGINASDEALCQAFEKVEAARCDIQLTYFEFGTLAALVLFADSNLDYLIMEVGLGGRLDAVNILEPDLSVLTNVALDHMDWLGETREEIGYEKSGIYRADKPALFGELDIPKSVVGHIENIDAVLYQKEQSYRYSLADDKQSWSWHGQNIKNRTLSFENLPFKDFALNYALDNAALALQAIVLLEAKVTSEHIQQGLQNVTLAGRFQRYERGHSLVLDVAHNPHAAKNLTINLQTTFPHKKIRVVIAMLDDKDIAMVLNLLKPAVFKWYISEIREARGASLKRLSSVLQQSNDDAEILSFDSITDAFIAAEDESDSEDVVLVTGSFYTVAAVLELI